MQFTPVAQLLVPGYRGLTKMLGSPITALPWTGTKWLVDLRRRFERLLQNQMSNRMHQFSFGSHVIDNPCACALLA